MSKNRELKEQVVAEIAEKLKSAQSVVIVEYNGLTVEEVTGLRKKFRESGVDYCVLKNKLVQRALKEVGIEGLDDQMEGPNAFAFGMKDAAAPAKIVTEFIEKADKDKKNKLKVKAGIIEKTVLDVKGVEALSKLPSKEELIAKMMGSLNAPITNFVGVLSATLRSLVYAIDAVRKQKAGE